MTRDRVASYATPPVPVGACDAAGCAVGPYPGCGSAAPGTAPGASGRWSAESAGSAGPGYAGPSGARVAGSPCSGLSFGWGVVPGAGGSAMSAGPADSGSDSPVVGRGWGGAVVLHGGAVEPHGGTGGALTGAPLTGGMNPGGALTGDV